MLNCLREGVYLADRPKHTQNTFMAVDKLRVGRRRWSMNSCEAAGLLGEMGCASDISEGQEQL